MRSTCHVATCLLLVLGTGLAAFAEDGKSVRARQAALQGESVTAPHAYAGELKNGVFRLQLDGIGGSAVADQLVSLLDSRGGTKAGRTSGDGVIEFTGVEPGLAGIAVTGNGVHASTALYLDEDGADDSVFRLPVVNIEREAVLRNVRSYLPAAGMASAVTSGPVEVEPAGGVFDYEIILGENGSLNGQTVVPGGSPVGLGDLNVLLYQAGHAIDRTLTLPDGSFRFEGLTPGVYGVIVAGRAGYAAVAFEAVAAESLPVGRPVSLKMNNNLASEVLIVSLVPPSMVPQLIEAINQAYGAGIAPGLAGPFGPGPLGAPGPFGGGMAGGPGGGFGGGVGGGGAGGGLGGLGGLAALGAIGAALAASDDDDAPVPASPFVP